jgi:hypothetical protein
MPAAPISCPICARPCAADAPRCPACGTDLYDPAVRELVGAPPAPEAPAIVAGELATARVLGCTRDGLADGKSARGLGLWLGLILLLSFVVPAFQVPHPYQRYVAATDTMEPAIRWEYKMVWDLVGGKARKPPPVVALLFPLAAGLLAVALALTPRVPPVVRAGGLALLGLLGLALCLGPHGRYAFTPHTLITVTNLGMLVGGVGVAWRLLEPTSSEARWVLVAGAGLSLIGLLIPAGALWRQLPGEYRSYADLLGFRVENATPLQAILGGLDRRAAPILFLSLWAALPILVMPLAIGFAWPRPQGPWDKAAPVLRPLAYLILLYLPVAYALYAFNMLGWGSVGADATFLPRARLILIAAPLALFAQLGALACVSGLRRKASAPAADRL